MEKKVNYCAFPRNGMVKLGRIMRLTFFIVLLGLLRVSANVYSQQTRMSLELNNVTLKEAFKEIEDHSNFVFFYNAGQVQLDQKVSLRIENKNIDEILAGLFRDKPITYKVIDRRIVLYPKTEDEFSYDLQQSQPVKGKVTDPAGEPLPGVTIVIKGTSVGTITDSEGSYSLKDVPENGNLLFSFVGMKTQEIPVTGKVVVNVTMQEESVGIEEVVAVGYGISRKRDIVSAMASVKGEIFRSASSSNVKDVLQGKVAGVDVQAARYPGDDREILIRGVRSLNAGNNPLIIVDGVPGTLGSISTNDIESIEVLKDAASSAIYGSMGANGVILVTTKRAKKNVKNEVNFSAYFGLNTPQMIPLQSGEEYAQFRRDGYRYAHGWENPYKDEDVFTPSELEVIKSGNYTDWTDLLYRDAIAQSYYLSVGNSGEKTKLYLSFKYDKEEGYYRTNDAENMNLTLTADHEMAKFWTIGTNIRLRRNNIAGFSTYGSPGVTYMTPLSKPYLDDGSLNYFPNPMNTSGYNPLANYLPGQYSNDKQTNSINITLTSNLKLSGHLTMRTNFGYIFNDYKSGYFYGKNSYQGKGVKSSSGRDYNNSDQYTLNNTLSYENNFGNHNLIIDLVGEIQQYKYDNSSLSGENQPVDYTSYYNLGSNTENITNGSGYSEWALASGLGRIRYNFLNKYMLNVAIRADGSSRLAKGNKWAFFPSGGIGWSLKDENFLLHTDWINSLKLRVSYGTVGNTAISPYQTQANLSQYAYLWGESSADKFYVYRPGKIINADLGWEISRTLNGGVDFSLMDSRFSGYVEVYRTRTDDVLMQRAIPTFTGFSQIWQNIGKTQNTGVEWNFTVTPVRSRDLVVDFTVNASRNWEKILELVSGEDLPNNSWFIGEPLGVHYNYEKIGIWQLGEETEAAKYNAVVGDVKIKDQDGDGSISAAKDRVILGQSRPKWLASVGGNIQYKNWDFSFNINSRWGYLIRPNPYYDLTMDGLRWIPQVDYWTPDNPTNDFPRADQASGYDAYRAANGYQKGDHIKLQDITLGYDFKGLISKRIPVTNMRLFIQVRNAAYLYRAVKWDVIPEAPDYEYTVPKSYNLGLNITF